MMRRGRSKEKKKPNIVWRLVKGLKPTPTKTDPNTLYHGTSSKNLASIKKHGIVPARRSGMGATDSESWVMSGGSRSDMVGLVGVTDRTRSAAFYASLVTPFRSKSARPIILTIDKKKLKSGKLVRRQGSSVGGGKEWDYPDRVPPSAIVGYWVLAKQRTGRREWVFKKRGRRRKSRRR
ncbi:MAG: hypothetical protein ACXADO_11440 [Candidatus Thorarchaeota archaeon]|jgi:hypothetical protein